MPPVGEYPPRFEEEGGAQVRGVVPMGWHTPHRRRSTNCSSSNTLGNNNSSDSTSSDSSQDSTPRMRAQWRQQDRRYQQTRSFTVRTVGIGWRSHGMIHLESFTAGKRVLRRGNTPVSPTRMGHQLDGCKAWGVAGKVRATRVEAGRWWRAGCSLSRGGPEGYKPVGLSMDGITAQ